VHAVGEEPAQPEAEEGSELPPAEAVAHAEAEVQHYEQVIAAGKATVTNAAAALDMEKQALAAVVKVCSQRRSCICAAADVFSPKPCTGRTA
jgi:hypothetical protein